VVDVMILAAATAFALMVTVGSNPAYEYDSFPSYNRCVEAAQGQDFDRNTRWDCVRDDENDDE